MLNSEKIEQFFQRMISDLFFRNYHFGLYDSLRLLHLRIFDWPAIVVSEVEKKWSSKINNVNRVEHLERIKSDDQGDRILWRKKIPALRVWRQKPKKHVWKRFRSNMEPDVSK